MAQPAACACGQVLFDIGDKKPGDGLTCPWCDRKYRYAGDGKVELLDGAKPPGEPAKAKASGDFAKPAESEKPANSKSDRLKKAETAEKKEKPRDIEAAILRAEKRDKKPDFRGGVDGDPGLVVRPSVRKRASKQEIPGGVMVMIIFIVVFNAAAFIAMTFLFPTQIDGTRITPWGTVIAKGSTWPLIFALLAGHFVGFIAWSTYLYKKQFHKNSAPPPPPPPTKA